MKRQNYTVTVTGDEAEDALAEYNKWLLHPKRPFDMPIKKFKEQYEKENPPKKRTRKVVKDEKRT